MKISPNIFPYIERIKSEPVPEARIEIAMNYIDFTIKQFEKAQHGMTDRQLLSFFKRAKNQWVSLVNKNIPMSEPDENGECDFLIEEMYESIFAQRALPLAETEEDVNALKAALLDIYTKFGWDTEALEEY